jgi:cytochrome b561
MPQRDRYTSVAIALHWAIAVLVLANIVTGVTHEWVAPAVRRGMMGWHKTFGLTVLLLTLIRVAWRLTHRPPPLPADMPRWEVWTARLTHWSFYALLIALPLTGWIFQSTSPRNPQIPFWGLQWPYLTWLHELPMDERRAVTRLWAALHERLAWVSYALLALHVAAALKHWLINGDNVMRHMVPWLKERRPLAKAREKTAV